MTTFANTTNDLAAAQRTSLLGANRGLFYTSVGTAGLAAGVGLAAIVIPAK